MLIQKLRERNYSDDKIMQIFKEMSAWSEFLTNLVGSPVTIEEKYIMKLVMNCDTITSTVEFEEE